MDKNGGGNFLGTPARSKSASRSDGQNSYTSRFNVRVPSSWMTRNPVAASTSTSRWTSQVEIGEMPGINQPSVRCGQEGPGSCPETEQNSTRFKFDPGGGRCGSGREGALARNASII